MPHRWDPIAPPVQGLVCPVPVDLSGLAGPTRGQAAGPSWRRTSPGLYVPASRTDELVEQRILEAACWAGEPAVVTGWAALRLHGGGYFDGLASDGHTRLPVPIAENGGRLRSRPGVLVVRDTMPDDEVVVVMGIRAARTERALFDELRRLGVDRPRDMVVAIDLACAAQLTSIKRMRRYCETRRWYRDKRIVSAPLDLAVEGARSRPEVLFRLIWELDARRERPLVNRSIFGPDGQLLGVPDLLDVGKGVVGEYAGADHRGIDQHQSDIAREALFRKVGLEYVEVVGRDLRDPARVVARLEEAEARAGLVTPTWVLGPEPGSLDELLDRRDGRVE